MERILQTHNRWNQLLGIAIFAIILLLASCGKKNPAGPDPDPDPPGDSNTISQEVGSDGGTVTSTDNLVTLNIPSGALSSTETITISVIEPEELGSEFDDIANEIGIDNAYDLGPDGLEFDMPITVSIDSDQTVTQQSTDTSESVSISPEFLFTSENGEATALDSLHMEIDEETGDITVAGELDHFSPLINVDITDGIEIVYRVSGVPDILPVGGTFTALALFDSGERPQEEGAIYIDGSTSPVEPLFEPSRQMMDLFDSGGEFVSIGEFDYECSDVGIGVYNSIGSGSVQFTSPTLGRTFFTGFRAGVFKEVECVEPEGPADPPTGIFPAPAGLTGLEVIENLPFPFANFDGTSQGTASGKQAAAQTAEGQSLALLSGQEGFIIFDLVSGDVLLDRTSDTSDPNTILLGVTAASQPDIGPTAPAVLFSFAQDQSFSPFGGFLLGYDTQNMMFSNFGQLIPGSYSDAFPAGGQTVSDEIVIVNNTGIDFVQFSGGFYTFVDSEGLSDSRFFGDTPISAYANEAGGPLLIATSGSTGILYFDDRTGEMATFVGELGDGARRIRCATPICAASLFVDSNIRIISWDGQTMPTIVGDPIPVGSGPVDLDLHTLTNGNVLIVSTGFSDDTVTLTKVDSSGNMVANDTYSVPTGCENPGHAIFIPNSQDADDPFIGGTCFGSENSSMYFITTETELQNGTTPTGAASRW